MKIAQQETAVAAFHEHVPSISSTQCGVILDAIQPGHDYSMSELVEMTGLQKSSISARLNKMRADGVLEHGPERKCRISGRTINPVRRKTA
ncbi:MarR family transcriptional regulator [Paraburkholderia tropica]|uniref:MarR family transcriptional regulator n=1 Tax=Paraburkholderia tropica TaxID=92647 RepID=UPI00160281E3|nr:helix-turn-helix domain-containing protein [Paraburkholderia tropica]QNB13460.1 MarR family transcriptional regulator [Paraburkholderia tropica]